MPPADFATAAQGHALFTRAAGSNIPCPQIDFDNGWNEYFAAVYKLPANETVKSKFGAAFGAQQPCHRPCPKFMACSGVAASGGRLVLPLA